ncbi:hypothetical protein SNE40_007974 [Patella caerulea]|uniref:Uncharacterized protein n=1 Tax=Patella caerulea TaxID=87958 RepID=A0AAN8JYS0_PATCE
MASHICSFINGTQFTDVVIVGNGPSAISLSFLLSGNRPYYNGIPHSNEILTRKLEDIKNGLSIVDQDLEYLSEGLEGRTSNPVALLLDALQHPDADLGADNPSLLYWKKVENVAIPHVVLGKTKPGGSWQRMDGSMQTLSLNSWMELPTAPFREWLAKKKMSTMAANSSNRATIADVKDYYLDFVQQKELAPNFYDYHTVTSVQKVFQLKSCIDGESGEVEPCCQNVKQNHSYLWEVRGYRLVSGTDDVENGNIIREEFCFVAPCVVLANGTYDIPNKLGVEGENLPNVIHSLSDFEKVIKNNNLSSTSDSILVVGAGLSAADAILMATQKGIPVVHSFRCSSNDPSLIFRKLPAVMYPEYHTIHSYMKGNQECELYKPYAKHKVVEIMEENTVLIQALGSDTITSVNVSYTVIMIGSRSDLSFLPNEGRNLGVVPKWPIDSKHNPFDINVYSYQSNYEPGLYAMGPLVGDNFVRFGIGGALGIVNHMLARQKE